MPPLALLTLLGWAPVAGGEGEAGGQEDRDTPAGRTKEGKESLRRRLGGGGEHPAPHPHPGKLRHEVHPWQGTKQSLLRAVPLPPNPPIIPKT